MGQDSAWDYENIRKSKKRFWVYNDQQFISNQEY